LPCVVVTCERTLIELRDFSSYYLDLKITIHYEVLITGFQNWMQLYKNELFENSARTLLEVEKRNSK
jgi:hypothetical protein